MTVYLVDQKETNLNVRFCLPTEAEDDGIDGLAHATEHLVFEGRSGRRVSLATGILKLFQNVIALGFSAICGFPPPPTQIVILRET